MRGRTAPTPVTDHAKAPRATSGTLEIVAVVTAFVLAPLGLVLGLVAIFRARRGGFRASILAAVAVILGAVLTVVFGVGIAAGVAVVGSIKVAADTKAICARYAADKSVLDDVDAFRPDMVKVTADYLPNHGPTRAEMTDVAAQAEKLSSRLYAVSLAEGSSYPRQWLDIATLDDELSHLARDLRSNQVASGEGSKPSTDETASLREEMTALCH